ncbi:hypothetical protein C8Q79DRAFT_712016 [Trametes meyenii]|nr:hypothetical protein C8Q79DRAFT_712016 [Trametes meyenii]
MEWLRDEPVWGGLSGILATNECGELRCTGTVRRADGAGELDAGKAFRTHIRQSISCIAHKSAFERLWRATNGFCRFTISSRPMLGWKPVSMSENMAMEPSAPPPLPSQDGEMAMASWNVRRRDSCASAVHNPPWNRFSCKSSRTAKSWQQAALVAVFLPSGQATRRRALRKRTVYTLEGGYERDGSKQRLEDHIDTELVKGRWRE